MSQRIPITEFIKGLRLRSFVRVFSGKLLCAILLVFSVNMFVVANAEDGTRPSSLSFHIKTIQVKGSTVLGSAQLRPILFRYVGEGRKFSDLQMLVGEVEARYREAGYPTVKVVLPPQDLTAGHVTLDVVEFQLGYIDVANGEYFDGNNLRRSVPELRSGVIPNNDDLARALETANKHPAKRLQVIFKPGRDAQRIDAELLLEERMPFDVKVSLHNEGTEFSGEHQLSIGARYSNLFGLDHTIGLQLFGAPVDNENFLAGLLTYRVPFYSLGGDLSLFGYYSEVDEVAFNNDFLIGGVGSSYGLQYDQGFGATANWKHKYNFGLAYKTYSSNVQFNGTVVNEVPQINSAPFSLGYSFLYQPVNTTWYTSLMLTATTNSDLAGSDDADFANARSDADARFWLAGLNAVVSTELDLDWRLRFRLNSQYTEEPLLPTEQFGIGGLNSFRGVAARQLIDDRGATAALEVYSPNMGRLWFGERYTLRFVVFADVAYLERIDSDAKVTRDRNLNSYGVGVRFQIAEQLSLNLDYAQLGSDSVQSAGLPSDDAGRLHLGLNWVINP